MKYARSEIGKSKPVGVAPQPNRNAIMIKGAGARDVIEIRDDDQFQEFLKLVEDAAHELGWKGFE